MGLFNTKQYDVSFWRSKIIPGKTFIKLSDSQAIKDSVEKEGDADGIEYLVKSSKVFKYNSIEWLFFDLQYNQEKLWLMVKIVNNEFEVRVYFEDDSFAQGNRHDMFNNGAFWLFQEPENMESFDSNPLKHMNKLKYTMTIGRNEDNKDLTYIQKNQGELYCKTKDSLATIVEYLAEDCENSEMIILEEGDSGCDPTKGDDGSGGYISLLIGSKINLEEIEVI